jgi:ribose-phosphate pyrophosphokinase
MGDPFMATGFGELKIFSGSAHPGLAREIAGVLGVGMGQARLRRFPDSEVSFQIDENIRGTDVFIVQPTSNPVDQHLVELMIMIDAFRRSSAARRAAGLSYCRWRGCSDRRLRASTRRRRSRRCLCRC